MLRRGLLVVTLVLLQRIPSAQIIAGVSVIVSAITMHFFARPFISKDLDNLEQVSLLSLVGLLCTGETADARGSLHSMICMLQNVWTYN
jgi:hypothetical protein